MSDEFSFGLGLEETPASPLSNTERRMLRELGQEGGPLWKVMKEIIDFGMGLGISLVNADFKTEEGRLVAIEIQSKARAAQFMIERFEAALTLEEEEKVK